MNEDTKTQSINLCMEFLYPEYFTACGAEKKAELMHSLLDEIYDLGLQELTSRVLFMIDHLEEKKEDEK